MSVLSTVVSLSLLVALLVLTAISSAADAAVRLLPRSRAKRLLAAERKGAKALDRVMARPGRMLASHALIAAVSYAATGALLTWSISTTYETPMYASVLAALGLASVIIFVFGEALPRTFALQSPERVALAVAAPAALMTAVVYPAARLLSLVWTWSMSVAAGKRVPGAPWVTTEEFEGLDAHGADGDPETAHEEIIDSLSNFGERIVREVMVPRTDMSCIEATATASEAIEIIAEKGFSRLPVFHENLDDIRGMLYAKDLLIALGRGWDPEMRVSRLVRSAYFVPETKPVSELLIEMRRTSHIAMVADEYGGTAGLVTIEDLLEEIVGEIFDEYDREVPLVVETEEGLYRVDARLPVTELNEIFETEIEREADSVGGLFIEEAGRIPEVGDSLDVEGLRLTVHQVEGNRILELTVEAVSAPEEGHDDGDHSE